MLINQKVLMSGADFFRNTDTINAHMDDSVPVDTTAALAEHEAIRHAFQQAGIEVVKVDPPHGCQDGVYTANWGLCRGDSVVLASLPNKRKDEEPYAAEVLNNLGKRLIYLPEGLKFSGQGDALPCGNYLFMGTGYRTDLEVHNFVGRQLSYTVVSLQTVPSLDANGKPIINSITGWPDSFFYDLDLALAVLTPTLIAWCPEAFTQESQLKIRRLEAIEKIEVPHEEAIKGLACNLVSTGETVVMSAAASGLKQAIETRGLKAITVAAPELAKGGGFIRCSSLTLD